jgi:hypothetical protein
MGAPQIIWLVLIGVSLGGDIARHGKPKTGTYNANHSVIAVALGAGLLWWGGFFG